MCTDEPPIGKVKCTDCEAPARMNECRTCDGHGECVRVITEHHEYELVTETAYETPEDYSKNYIQWESDPERVYEPDTIPEFLEDEITGPTIGKTCKMRVKEYGLQSDKLYRFEYTVDDDFDYDRDLYKGTDDIEPFTVYVVGDEASGLPPRVRKSAIENHAEATRDRVNSLRETLQDLKEWGLILFGVSFSVLMSLVVVYLGVTGVIGFPPENLLLDLVGYVVFLALGGVTYIFVAGGIATIFDLTEV